MSRFKRPDCYCFTAPAIPSTKYRCINKNSTIMGKMLMVAAAAMPPQSTKNSPLKRVNAYREGA